MLDAVPSCITAGETPALRLSIPSTPAPAWSVRWVIEGPGTTRISVTATADGDAHVLTLAQADSERLLGTCRWQLWASKGTENRIVGSGVLQVDRGLASVSHAQRCLEAVEAALLKSVGQAAVEYELDGLRVKHGRTELLQLRDRFRAEVRRERGLSPFAQVQVTLG